MTLAGKPLPYLEVESNQALHGILVCIIYIAVSHHNLIVILTGHSCLHSRASLLLYVAFSLVVIYSGVIIFCLMRLPVPPYPYSRVQILGLEPRCVCDK